MGKKKSDQTPSHHRYGCLSLPLMATANHLNRLNSKEMMPSSVSILDDIIASAESKLPITEVIPVIAAHMRSEVGRVTNLEYEESTIPSAPAAVDWSDIGAKSKTRQRR